MRLHQAILTDHVAIAHVSSKDGKSTVDLNDIPVYEGYVSGISYVVNVKKIHVLTSFYG